jgi:dihydroorotate dehydrogenase electron transfer subunit
VSGVAVRLRRADLTATADERGAVLAVEELGGGLVELSVRLPLLAARTVPGQFAQLRCGPGPVPLLRRPFSVAWVDGDACAFVFERVGEGTRRLAALHPGDPLDSLGPLGVGFTLPPAAGRVLIVAGGLGCAPFPLAARWARQAGAEVVVLSGAATAARLYPPERYRRGGSGIAVVEATDDGSRGHRGMITDLVELQLREGVGALWACGPNPMLATLAGVLAIHDTAPLPAVAETSLEAPMGCGFGTCLGCALPVDDGDGRRWALCCSEGPVMPITAVDWERLRELPPAHVA